MRAHAVDDVDDVERVAAVVRACALATYDARGREKTSKDAYTTLCAFCIVERNDAASARGTCYVAAFATGTKCVPMANRARDGGAIGDCHAEVLARRALTRWLQREYAEARDGRASVFEVTRERGAGCDEETAWDEILGAGNRVRMRAGVEVHAYCSQSPCGDASVFELPSEARRGDGGAEASTATVKRAKTTGGAGGGAGVTGAKILTDMNGGGGGGGGADPERDRPTQEVGAVRWKPGRGAPSFCLSCSDKMCRWQMHGLQGTLMRLVAREAIKPRSICVSIPNVCEERAEETKRVVALALKRAIVKRARLDDSQSDDRVEPRCVAVDAPSDDLSSYRAVVDGDRVASPTCVTYVAPSRSTFEFNDAVGAVDIASGRVERLLGAIGFLHGYGKKCRASGAASSALCARELCASFDADVLSRLPPRARRAMENKPYAAIKREFRAFRSRDFWIPSSPPLPGKDKSDHESFVPFPRRVRSAAP